MKTRLLTILALTGLLAAAVGGCNIPEPPAPCLIGRPDFYQFYVVHYSKTSSGPDCMNYSTVNPTWAGYFGVSGTVHPMDGSLDMWKIEKYGRPGNVAVKDFAVEPVALSQNQLNSTTVTPQDLNTAHSFLAKGALDSYTVGSDGLCKATGTISPAEQDIGCPSPSTPGCTQANSPVIYQLSNLQWLGDSAHQGSEMGGTLRYTDGACTATYKFIAVYPSVGCTTDSDCIATPQTDGGPRISGSGLQPDLPVKCDTTDEWGNLYDQVLVGAGNIGLCVLSGDFPQTCANCNAQ